MSSKKGFVSVILLNYNGKEFNCACINSILKQTYNNYEIIFVDNKSTDGSLEQVEDFYRQEIKSGKIKIVKNSENLWFAGGNNSGVKESSNDSEYIWLLNNDTIIEKNCLEELVKGIESDLLLGGVSSVIYDKGCKNKVEQKISEGKICIMNVFGLQIWEKAEIKNNIYYTNFLCGCSFLYKKDLIKYPFLDFYKIYAEDVQLSWELILKGYKLGVCKKSKVYHFGSATMNKVPYTKIYLNIRNLFINYYAFLSKNIRLKLAIPFFIMNFFQIISNYKMFGKLLKAKLNCILWVKKNKKIIDIVRTRINDGRKISEKEFLSTMTYKLAGDDFHSGKMKLQLINLLNYFNKIYFLIFSIPFREK